jgi:hypothetical protein
MIVCHINIIPGGCFGNEGLQEISNANEVRVINFVTSKNLLVKSTMLFIHSFIHSYIFICSINPYLALRPTDAEQVNKHS